MLVTYPHWSHVVSGYLLIYSERTLADLPMGVEKWLVWAWSRGHAAQWAAAFLSRVPWPGRVTLDRDPLVPRASQAELLRIADKWQRDPRRTQPLMVI